MQQILSHLKDSELALPEHPHARPLQPPPQAQPPERPARAPDVELLGELPETGFADKQWLVRRQQRFIQLTELLYLLLASLDGQRTLAEIAAELTASTDWQIDPEQVRYLIQTRLIPLKLVVEDAAPGQAPGRAADESERSPLAVTMRMRMLSPRLIEPLTRVLQLLFWPPLAIPVLSAIVSAHFWLYGVHGISGSIHATLSTPGWLFLVLAIMIVAAIFHELGHASALHYSGGRTRGIGAGFYLIYPAFYTDVTDSYRLGRWGRVRTDLGGIYFHLLFALGLIVLGLATNQAFVLFAVLLIDLEIVRQFVPFVRLDGYWVLADLTGIPDFFSQFGPFVRSIVPRLRRGGRPLPRLRPWVRAVFVVYMAVTIPVLGLMVWMIVAGVPELLTTTWDSTLIQSQLLTRAWESGDLLMLGAVVTQMVLLALPVLGTGIFLYSFARAPLRLLWRWSRSRRYAG